LTDIRSETLVVKFRIDANDIVGHEFGKLKVLWWSHHNGKRHFYRCLCQCGKLHTVTRSNLIHGSTTKCNCYHADNDEELMGIIMRTPFNKNGCRIFQGHKDGHGYGRIFYKGKMTKVHVQAARLFIGPRPDNLLVMHSCACKPCCNPAHLSYGSNAQNTQDSYDKEKRAKRGEAMNLEKARQARAMYPRMTLKEISKRFGCSVTHISGIVNNKRWREPIITTPEDDWSSHNHYQPKFNF